MQKKTKRKLNRTAAEGLLRNRRGVGTCVRSYVLDTRAPVYGCVHEDDLRVHWAVFKVKDCFSTDFKRKVPMVHEKVFP